MKRKVFVFSLLVAILSLVPVACNNGGTTSSTSPSNTTPEMLPPTAEELAAGHFVLPEIPRILCEQLKLMIDRGDDFILVDTRGNTDFKNGYLPGATNIPTDGTSPPFTQEWVTEQLKALPRNKLIIMYCA